MHWTEQLFKHQAESYTQFFENRFDLAADETRELLEFLEHEREVVPDRVLDVACGTGRHVFAFADEGCDAEGLDFSEEFIDRAQERAAERELANRVTFHVHDMRDLEQLSGTFDLVTNFWNSMGYYDKATDEKILSAMKQMLAEDGVVAIETGNKEYYVKNFQPAAVSEDEEHRYTERRTFDIEAGKFHTRLDIFSITDTGYEHLETMEWEQRQYAPVEWKEMCENAGFDHVSLHGGLDGASLSLDSDTVVVLAV